MVAPRTVVQDVTVAPAASWGRARWRLRDLGGRDRRLALALFTLLLLPFVVALVRAFRDGWIPSGDEANIATRALDVFSRHPPLTGLPSTSQLYGGQISTNHPGPIEFYLLAVPLRALGMTAGPLLTAAAINCGCVLVAAWVFFRRLGLSAMLWAGVLLLAVMWSGGTAVLSDTLSSNMTMYSVLCTAVLAWALIDGDLRLLPLAALVASYSAQQHLAAGLMVVALVVVATVALAVQIVIRVRRGEEGVKKAALLSSLTAIAIAAVCWAPVLIDEFTGHPGNLTAIVRFARDNARPKLGLAAGFYQGVHSVAPPTVLGRTDTTGLFFIHAPGLPRVVLCLLVVAALCAVAVKARVRSPGVTRLASVALVLLVAGVFNGSNVPKSFEQARVNLYRWTWSAAFITWAALGLGVAFLAARAVGRSAHADRVHRLAPPALLVVAALIATSIVFVSGADDHNRERPEFALEKRINAAVLAAIDRHRPVLVNQVGSDAQLSVVPELIFRLVEAGVSVKVPGLYTSTYGNERAFQPGSDVTTIVVSSGWARGSAGPGKLLAFEHFGPRHSTQFDEIAYARATLIGDLAATARGRTVKLVPNAKAIVDREYPGLAGYTLGLLLNNLGKDPQAALGDPSVLKLILQGVVVSPVLDQSKVRRVLDLPVSQYKGTFGDEQVEVHLLSPAQAAICARRPCFSAQ